MRHAPDPFETTKNHLRKQITLKTGSGRSHQICGRRMDGRTTDDGRTHTHDIFEGTYTISPGGQKSGILAKKSGILTNKNVFFIFPPTCTVFGLRFLIVEEIQWVLNLVFCVHCFQALSGPTPRVSLVYFFADERSTVFF